MAKTRGAFSVATAVLLLAVVTACGSDSDPDSAQSPSPSISETVSSPSAKPTTPSPEAAAEAAATKLVTSYYAVTDLLLQDPTVGLDRLDTVAISIQLSALQKFLAGQRDAGVRQTGDTQVVETQVQSVSLDNSDPKAGRVPSVNIDVCWDVSDGDVVDAAGKSVVPTERPDRGWTRYTVSNYSWDADPDGGWRVANGQDLKKSPCTG